MAQREELLKIEVISDDDTGMYRMGEIETVPRDAIKEYVEQYDEFAYTEILEFCAQMISVAREQIMHNRKTLLKNNQASSNDRQDTN